MAKYSVRPRQYSKVKVHDYHQRERDTNYKPTSIKQIYRKKGAEQRILGKKKSIQRSSNYQAKRLSQEAAPSIKFKQNPERHQLRAIKRYYNGQQQKMNFKPKAIKQGGRSDWTKPVGGKLMKVYFNEQNKTYFHANKNKQRKTFFNEPSKVGDDEKVKKSASKKQKQYKLDKTEKKADKTFIQQKNIKRYFNKNKRTIFVFGDKRQHFYTKSNNKPILGRTGKKADKIFIQQKNVKRHFNKNEKTIFVFGDKQQYFHNKPVTVLYRDGKIIRKPKTKRTEVTNKKESNLYFVPGLKQKRPPTRLQQAHDNLSQNKVYRSAKQMIRVKADQELEKAGEDNVGVRALHRSGQFTFRMKSLVAKNLHEKYMFVRNGERFNQKIIKKYQKQEIQKVRNNPCQKPYTATTKLYQKKYLNHRSDRQPDKAAIKKAMQKRHIQYKHIQEQLQKFTANPIRILVEIAKQFIIRNAFVIGLISGALLLMLLATTIMMGFTMLSAFITMISYPADHKDLDEICEYIEAQDAAYIDMFEHMGDNYYLYTLTYEGTGVIQTNKRHMISYLTAKILDQLTMDNTQETIDWFFERMYTYESWEVWEQISTNPDRFVWHLYVTVDCKTVEQVINENNLLEDESMREYYKMLNRTGGTYFPPLSANPFPDKEWSAYITSPYGWRIHPVTGGKSFHSGVDIGMPEGTEISSVQSGTVVATGYNSIEGNYITIDDGTTRSTYMHCSVILSSMGDTVSEGDVIALVGNTGRSTGPHLHLSMWIDGVMVDPMEHVSSE